MFTAVVLSLLMSAEDADWAPPPTEAETAAAASLTDAAGAGEEAIKTAAADALAQLGEGNPSSSVLKEAAASGKADDAKRAAESLTFRPRAEAPLAVGYPNPTRVHAIEVKTLPAYRMATTSMEGENENRAFWNLFGHIQKEGIAMTAPVRMDYDGQSADETSMAFLYREQFRVLFLNKRNALIADEVLHEGTVDHTPAYPREVIRRAIKLSATALLLVHNHPSGDPTPSRADVEMTKQIIDAGKPLGIAVHDHIIMGRDGHASLKGLQLI